jgi:hypothetical protein
MKKITPFLWFDSQAEEAMNFYVSLFKNSQAGGVSRGPDGKAFSVSFELDGQEFMGMNAGPQFKFNEAVGTSSLQMGAKKACAAGARISLGCGGRSSRNSWAIISVDPTRSKLSAECKPCFKCTSSSLQI